MRNILLTVAYDGTDYCGWQVQPNGISVAGEIINAIKHITGQKVVLYGSGRTDAGVHACAQTANFYTDSDIPVSKFPAALNSRLDRRIVVTEAREAGEEFNARFSATGKTYEYLIDNSPIHSPFLLNKAWHYRHPLDIDAMNEVCGILIGKRDFAAFMATGSKVKNTVRTLYELKCERSGDLMTITASADGFLYNMVRIITGTLVYVGGGKMSVSDVENMLALKDRTLGGLTAPACGLYLKKVFYEDCF